MNYYFGEDKDLSNSVIDFFSLKGPKQKGTSYIRNVTLLLRFTVTKGKINFKIVC